MNVGWKGIPTLGLVTYLSLSGCGVNSNIAIEPPGSVNIEVSKYASFDAALAACPHAGSCILSVPSGKFATSHYGQNCISRSNTRIVGSGQPTYDNPNAPTRLVGGTVVQPGLEFCGASNVAVSDLGVDDGPAYVAGGGAIVDGFVYDGRNDPDPSDPLWTDNTAERITSLGSSMGAAVHAFRFEHGSGLSFDGLVATYDTHCVAIKADHVTGGSVTAQACSSDEVIIKSDNYTAISDVNIASINARSLAVNDSQNGVVFDSEATTGSNRTSTVHIGNIQAAGIYSAVTFLANGAAGDGAVNNVTVDALTVDATFVGPPPDCVQSTAAAGQTFQFITISNVQCVNNTDSGGFTAMRLYSPVFNTQINNWTTLGQINPAYLNGGIKINGWYNGGTGAPAPVFYLIGGTSTNVNVAGYTNTVVGSSLYASDGAGETIELGP